MTDVPTPPGGGPPPESEPLALSVDPLRIADTCGAKDVRAISREAGAVRDGDWDMERRTRFVDTPVFRAIVDVVVLDRPWTETKHFAQVARSIEAGRPRFGCTTVAEFEARGERLQRLYRDIREDGYRSQPELGSRRVHDEVRVAIDRDGRFLLVDGRHRLAIARILGLREIPVLVTRRHASWEAFRREVGEYAAKRDGRVYQVIDHPDLAHIPAHHGTERVAFVERALSDRDRTGQRILDIGTHWGYMARQGDRLGLRSLGVELNRRNARFARQLCRANDSRADIWEGDVFEFPELEQQHVVLALNVFHHLIRTQESHDRLAATLGRMQAAEVIVFEAHKSENGQLRDAYRNYPADGFARFVARHAHMSTVEPLGRAADGRELFRISR